MKSFIRNKQNARAFLGLGMLMLALVPTQAMAHDNLGGDEFAVANWMLVAAIVTIVIGVLWAIWAISTGQFHNIESSKYTMLESAEDYDKIMADFDASEKAAKEAAAKPIPTSTTAKPAVVGEPVAAAAAAKTGGTTVSV
jgi:nitrogen fixation-related uncharacterized protein